MGGGGGTHVASIHVDADEIDISTADENSDEADDSDSNENKTSASIDVIAGAACTGRPRYIRAGFVLADCPTVGHRHCIPLDDAFAEGGSIVTSQTDVPGEGETGEAEEEECLG